MELTAVIVAPFVMAFAILLLRRVLRAAHQGWLLSGTFAASFVLLLSLLPTINEQGSISLGIEWIPQIGLSLSLYVDGLALFFGLLVTGIACAVFFYAGYYFEDGQQAGRFYALLLGFTGSMLLLVTAGNLLLLFIAWELTSVISFLLISFKWKDAEARRGASQALVVTGAGGLALLVGVLLVQSITGSAQVSDVLSSGELLRSSTLAPAIIAMILLGAFTKSAQFPFHFWLPQAMAAPTPASAFLHSATMVKAGIFLLLRFYPVFGSDALWTTIVPVVGLTTMLLGALLSLRQQDLKGMLAFSTISLLGALVALIGLPDSFGLKAAMVGILAHALYKCTLFLVVGAVDHATGTRNIDELGGLRMRMPGFAAVTLIAGLSMAGFPPLLGFVAKETLIDAVLDNPVALVIVMISAALTVTVALRLFAEVFLGKTPILLPQPEHEDHDKHHPLGDDAYDFAHFHAVPRLMVAGPALLAALSIITGLGLTQLVVPLIQPALSEPVKLYLFPPEGINLVLLLSMTVLAAGGVVFATRQIWLKWAFPSLFTGSQGFGAIVGGVEWAGDRVLTTQGGKIRFYLAAILICVLILLVPVTFSILSQTGLQIPPLVITSAAEVLKIVLLVMALGATLASILFARHLLAALSLGLAGYLTGGIFLLEPAPDVALVQFLVETLATVLIIIILARTSEKERRRAMARVWEQSRAGVGRDVLISIAMGAAVTVFALTAISSRPTPDPVADWYLQNSLPQVYVTDVVAGIITDFRGTDTLIEITVFAMAALGVLTLLARPKPGSTMRLFGWGMPRLQVNEPKAALQEDAERPESFVYRSHLSDPITQFGAVLVLPIALLIAVSQILYAGSGPGDGFTAGVISGLGVALWYVVFGYEETKRRLRWLHPTLFIGAGLLIAYTNALLPLLFGREFLAFTLVPGFSFADIKLASPLLFEIGICLTVFGGISAILEAISHPREVESP
ncbi:MAG TPA: hydrogen gas-evolving membrane-bound hydrogenase subunit E [Candidatus Limnocylindrales bacterium]|nr:hydrogen gas-evolving membrane-bound hydrogenase subunit E [Candidatus Limnocylindrales bacterium]